MSDSVRSSYPSSVHMVPESGLSTRTQRPHNIAAQQHQSLHFRTYQFRTCTFTDILLLTIYSQFAVTQPTVLVSICVTVCAAECNWSRWDLTSALNKNKLCKPAPLLDRPFLCGHASAQVTSHCTLSTRGAIDSPEDS